MTPFSGPVVLRTLLHEGSPRADDPEFAEFVADAAAASVGSYAGVEPVEPERRRGFGTPRGTEPGPGVRMLFADPVVSDRRRVALTRIAAEGIAAAYPDDVHSVKGPGLSRRVTPPNHPSL